MGAIGSDVFGSDFSVDVVVHPGAGAYICGEETALLESLEGKRGFPRIKPPYYSAVIGLYGDPTIVNNVETLSNLPWIVLHGGAAFAAMGEEQAAGSRIFSLSRPREAARELRAGSGKVDIPRPHLRPGLWSVLLEVHDEWQIAERRYLSKGSMAKLYETDNDGAETKEVGIDTKELLAG